MYRNEPYTGADLPPKTLCLTYDDGPGEDTYAIAKFLNDENIRATFFVVGKYAFHHQDILEKIAAMGHLVGNHTYEHPDMPYYLSVNGNIHNQVLGTDGIIKKYISEKTVYFRSPYGKWSAEVANELNMNLLTMVNHIGPVYWDVGGIDCHYWKNGFPVEDAVKKYLDDIKVKDHGIVVMHDGIADMNYLRDRNKTLELTKQLIPLLKLQGYQFVRLDEIESIKRDVRNLFRFTLKSSNGKFISLSGKDDNAINVNGKGDTILNKLSMEDLGHGTIALKASNGLFFSLQPGPANTIEASSKEINKYETFDLIPISSNQVALRAYNGHYLTRENNSGGRLIATAEYMRGAECFSFAPVGTLVKNDISLRKRLKTFKRQILYIKSKIQQAT